MSISVPDTLTNDSAGKYIMSIRLRSDGLSFSCHDPSVGGSFFYQEVGFDRTIPFSAALKDFFFENEFLTWNYKRTHVLCVTPTYTVVPKPYFLDDQKKELLGFCFTKPDGFCLNDTLQDGDAEIVFSMEEEVYGFCSRSLLHPHFSHPMKYVLALWRKQSLASDKRQLYAVVEQKRLDLACYKQGQLLFVNSFRIDNAEDVVYYILYVWKQLGLDQRADQLYLQSESSLRVSVAEILQTYLRKVSPMEIPAEAYLCGADVAKAPLDLISLLVCE